jgi:undecaprenyl-diphosphatase
MTIYEPQRWKELMSLLNHYVSSDPYLFKITSLLSDFIVFLFPLLLIWLYRTGRKNNNKERQYYSLGIFLATCISAWINIIIQYFVVKDRPETLPGLKLILSHLPTMSFPSDHASVSMWFAVAFLLFFGRTQRIYAILWFCLILGSIIMGISRTAVAVHRPSDILVWWIIWIIWGYLWYALCKISYTKKVLDGAIQIGNNILDYLIAKKFRS